VLGCTHYPMMADVFQDALGPEVKVFSQGEIVAKSLADYLKRHPELKGTGKDTVFLTTGNPKSVSNQATRFLRRDVRFQQA